MAYPRYPDYPGEVNGGDDITHSPQKTTPSLLASERATQHTRRLETDANRNLYVRVAEDDTQAAVTALASGSQANVGDNLLTTIVTHTAATDTRISRIGVSGTIYGKIQMVVNTIVIETKRMGPDRNVEFSFPSGFSLTSGQILDVKVIHQQSGNTGDFEATVYGV